MKSFFSVDIDCDSIWVYESDHNINYGINNSNLIYIKALYLYLKLLKKYKIKATFFIVGKDLKNKDIVNFFEKAIADGHQIANHTFNHYSNFSEKSNRVVYSEIYKANNLIIKKLKIQPRGFRAPSYNINSFTDSVLKKLNYSYNASHFPGLITFFFKFFFLSKGKIKSFSLFKNLFGRNKFEFKNNFNIFHFPIATATIFRLPVHPSVIYFFGVKYFNFVMKNLINSTGHHNLLFHAADLFDIDNGNKFIFNYFKKNLLYRTKLIEMYFKIIKNKVVFKEDFIKKLSSYKKNNIIIS